MPRKTSSRPKVPTTQTAVAEEHSESSEDLTMETRMCEMVFPNQTNHYGTLFGGHALELMDKSAFITASRFTRKAMVTASSEKVDFKTPVKTGHLVELVGKIEKVGRTSVTVSVDMVGENLLTGDRQLCARGRFVLVAVDPDNRPIML
ncbi:MAG: acyl-CoA thioesterase [Candidatus Obscuribacterales bacterium]|nr:acyl-CoA thioesterase [Candidatus Obscuribacterales bacterium]